ncbi:MAG: acetylxylan esterase [Planctomycetota bacterium]
MDGPDDFGLSALETLTHVASFGTPSGSQGYWTGWRDRLLEVEPTLRPRDGRELDDRDGGIDWTFEGGYGLPIGCTLVEPPTGTALAGGVVVLHGAGIDRTAEQDRERWRLLAARGVAVLVVRVRGYAGSSRDTGDLTVIDDAGHGWICRGLDALLTTPGDRKTPAADEWVLPRAIMDVANGVRALRSWVEQAASKDLPVGLYGVSLGGGLGVMASAQLGEVDPSMAPDRLAVGMPSLGDWPWRLDDRARRSRGGTGSMLADYLLRNADREEDLLKVIRWFDSAVHARHIASPVLCMLAERDDVVPAPTAAAVFNALGSDPGCKWRFLVRAGHTDAGLSNNRRLALFHRCCMDFLDFGRPPIEAMRAWQPVMRSGDRAPDGLDSVGQDSTAGASGAQGGLFGGAEVPGWTSNADRDLIEAYEAVGRTLDDLPYTREFETVLERIAAGESGRSPREVLRRLQNLRKAGRLPKAGPPGSKPVKVEPEDEQRLEALVIEEAGSLGQRDGLPYTPAFDRVVERFNDGSGRSLDPHSVWRLVARMAK